MHAADVQVPALGAVAGPILLRCGDSGIKEGGARGVGGAVGIKGEGEAVVEGDGWMEEIAWMRLVFVESGS